MNLILFLLVVWSLSYLVAESQIFYPIRVKLTPMKFLGKLINCLSCSSFWVGCLVHFIWPITPFFLLSGLVALGAINLFSRFVN